MLDGVERLEIGRIRMLSLNTLGVQARTGCEGGKKRMCGYQDVKQSKSSHTRSNEHTDNAGYDPADHR